MIRSSTWSQGDFPVVNFIVLLKGVGCIKSKDAKIFMWYIRLIDMCVQDVNKRFGYVIFLAYY